MQTLFQSHNGAIAARQSPVASRGSEKVSIPQWCDCCYPIQAEVDSLKRSFNPTMVRLLQEVARKIVKMLERFNPTMVRLLQGGGDDDEH